MVKAFRIIHIDTDQVIGREHPPEETDIGLIVVPLQLDVTYCDDVAGTMEPVISKDGDVLEEALDLLLKDQGEDDTQHIETCYTCLTPDGRIVQLMDFELESILEGDLL